MGEADLLLIDAGNQREEHKDIGKQKQDQIHRRRVMDEDIPKRIERGGAGLVTGMRAVAVGVRIIQVDAGEMADRSEHIVALFLHHVLVDVVDIVGPVVIGCKTFRKGDSRAPGCGSSGG